MRQDLPVGTVTLVFTDIEGSTRLLEELGPERYGELLARHHRACRAAWAAHGGVEVDTAGDAFFVAFENASDALAAAREAQRSLVELGMRVRMGVHTGDVAVSETGYVGFEVHRAARIAAAAHGGQVVVSETAAVAAGRDGLVELGEHRFKDVPEPVAIFQLGEGSFPPLKTISNTNLPRPASSFVGRERELERVLAGFEHGARLVTLTGPGGSGKTRLAIEAATTLVPEFKAGVFWVGLAALRDPALVTQTIAQTVGAKDGLAEHIGERELLLLLDNLEQVIEAAPELSALLRACPSLRLLVTSRELLRVDGEVEYAVPPLAEPEAVALFCERAQLEPRDEIRELCGRLDNLPLAVELAAARTKVLAPAQILERLSRRLDLLKGGRDTDPRQQTLRATIEWSYDLLTQDEQRLFRAQSVFAGGCRLEAAEEVCDAELDTLQSLVEKSLVRFTNGRYWMLETIREFAAEMLASAADAARTHGKLIDWAAGIVDTTRLTRAERGRPERIDRIRAEYPNIRAALEMCMGAERWSDLASLCSDLGGFWIFADHLADGRSWFSEALAAPGLPTELRLRLTGLAASLAMQHGDHDAAVALNEAQLELARGAGNDLEAASAMRKLAVLAAERGDLVNAAALHRESVSEARRLGDPLYLCAALGDMGLLALAERDFERARDLALEAVALSREAGVAEWVAIGLANAGEASLELGDAAAATELLMEAVRTAAEQRAWTPLAAALLVTGALALGAGRPELASRLLGACDVICERQAYVLSGGDARRRNAVEDVLVDRLGHERFEALAAEGRGLSPEDAAELALSLDSS